MPVTASSPACAHPSQRPPGATGSFAALKERQLLFLLTRQLAHAQFERADAELSARLWQEVAHLEIDPERITLLLYSGVDLQDAAALQAVDDAFLARQVAPTAQGWSLLRPWARPAGPPPRCGRSAAVNPRL